LEKGAGADMCGIVGYIGHRDAVPVLLEGLRRLEYRGYDSAGIGILGDNRIGILKRQGKLKVLEGCIGKDPLSGNVGIGHTRWATHGVPSEENAHPHIDCTGAIAVVHNGIVENYQLLKSRLMNEGHRFVSQTDTEVIPHLIEKYNDAGNLKDAIVRMANDLTGNYALCIMSLKEPDVIVAVRCGSPLIIGIGEGENFIASDVPAVLKYTREVVYLDDHEIAVVKRDSFSVVNSNGVAQSKEVSHVRWDTGAVEKCGYRHFMLKEIHEQSAAVSRTLRGRINRTKNDIILEEENVPAAILTGIDRISAVACGTAWHAGLTGKYMIETLARIPVEVDISSEFRYRDPMLDKGTLVVAISQSGETADTLASLREAKKKKAKVLAICNVVGSTVSRESDGVIYTHAGPEIGVASTKAYTSQLAALYLLTIKLGRLNGSISEDLAIKLIGELEKIPGYLERILENSEVINTISECADRYHHAPAFMFIGRNFNLPNAYEGALKLKEISYIHAEGYGAGEMKHGPIAIIEPGFPVVCIATRSTTYGKMISNIQEIKARKGVIISIATEGDEDILKHSDHVVHVPDTMEVFSPVLVAVPLQLLAYYIAVRRGCDVDQPRNLAKSVTVE
jgi:glucosamine--fructose-6-phosphate aminotransferase (isomerizing)